MERRHNPYAPGAGLQPPELSGRDGLIADADMDRLLENRPVKRPRSVDRPWASIDEVQYLARHELAALIVSCHEMAQRNLPPLFIGAGLPQLAALAGNAKSYAERLFTYRQMGPLEPEARIRRIDVQQTTPPVIAHLDANLFRVRFDRLTALQQKYLRSMAQLGPGPHKSGDIAATLGVTAAAVATARQQLIDKGMIWSPRHGETAFTVPMFDTFMKRQMPVFEQHEPKRRRPKR